MDEPRAPQSRTILHEHRADRTIGLLRAGDAGIRGPERAGAVSQVQRTGRAAQDLARGAPGAAEGRRRVVPGWVVGDVEALLEEGTW